MEINLFNLLERELSGDVVTKIASFLGEGSASTRAAVDNAVPAVMCALHEKTSTAGGLAELLGMLRRGGFDGTALATPASMAGSGGLAELAKVGGPLVASLFGTRLTRVVDWLANASGIGKSAASSLLGIVVPFVLNLLGGQAGKAGALDAGSIGNLIKGQASHLRSKAPSGLAQALGVGQCGETVSARAYSTPAPTPFSGTDSGGDNAKLLLPVLGVLLLNLLYFGWRVYNTDQVQKTASPVAATVPAPAQVPAPPAPVAASAPAPVLVRQVICAGREIEVGENGVESKLIAFLDDTASIAGGDQWFSFDRIEFETDSAVLKRSSVAQLKNIAEIMQCYPTVELKIGGYTDSTADDAYNLKLSQERADNAKAELVSLGVAESRLAAVGYGEQYPVASNDTEEGRQRNRRTDVTVTKK